jgi:hypothetical protein
MFSLGARLRNQVIESQLVTCYKIISMAFMRAMKVMFVVLADPINNRAAQIMILPRLRPTPLSEWGLNAKWGTLMFLLSSVAYTCRESRSVMHAQYHAII